MPYIYIISAATFTAVKIGKTTGDQSALRDRYQTSLGKDYIVHLYEFCRDHDRAEKLIFAALGEHKASLEMYDAPTMEHVAKYVRVAKSIIDQINKEPIFSMSVSNIIKSPNIVVWEHQRLLREERVAEMCNCYVKLLTDNPNASLFISNIAMARDPKTDKYYVIDGQHRLAALMRLAGAFERKHVPNVIGSQGKEEVDDEKITINKAPTHERRQDIERLIKKYRVPIISHDIADIREIRDLFELHNKLKPIELWEREVESPRDASEVVRDAVARIVKKYAAAFCKEGSQRVLRNKMPQSELVDRMMDVIASCADDERGAFNDVDGVVKWIEDFNTYLFTLPLNVFMARTAKDNMAKIHAECEKQKFIVPMVRFNMPTMAMLFKKK